MEGSRRMTEDDVLIISNLMKKWGEFTGIEETLSYIHEAGHYLFYTHSIGYNVLSELLGLGYSFMVFINDHIDPRGLSLLEIHIWVRSC